VGFLEKIGQRLLLVLQFILVFLFILFEEIIWEGIAKPIYNKIESLQITQKIESKIKHTNRYVLLVIFLVLLLGVEIAGLLAGLFFVQGYVLFGLLLYLAKIPIAAFVFWLFKVGKKKLLSFDWFNWTYKKIMSGVEWLKATSIYKDTMEYMRKIKRKIRAQWMVIKKRYFNKEGSFTEELKSFYNYMKNFKNNIKMKKEDEKND
jgi:hypothetical protein